MALVYETGGSEALIPDVCVAIVRRVVTPRHRTLKEYKRLIININLIWRRELIFSIKVVIALKLVFSLLTAAVEGW